MTSSEEFIHSSSMSRRIEFRVWDKKRNHFLIPWCGNGYEDIDLLYADGNWYFEGGSKLDENYILQQFTGIKDKNGKEIYEGDLVKFKWINPAEEVEETIGEVFWDDEMAMFSFDQVFNFAMNDSCFIQESLEVVGNIFENPNSPK